MQEPIPLDALIREAAGLRRLAVELVGDGAADDVLQDALAASLSGAPLEAEAARPWLQRVIRNLAASRHRSGARRADRERLSARHEELPSSSELVERMEVQRVVAEEVLRLEEPYRAAILAVHFEGVAAEAYARARGVPGTTVRSWTKRGLDTLRARLDRRFGGDRRAWSACLLVLARPPASMGVTAAWKSLVAALLVLAGAVGVAWWWPSQPTGSPRAAPEEVPALADAGTREALGEPSGPAAGALESTSASARIAIDAPADAGVVLGRVTWQPDGAPAVDFGVRLLPVPFDPNSEDPPQVASDAQGRFRFERVAPGAYELLLDRSTVRQELSVGPGTSVEHVLEVPPGYDLTGRVLAPDGEPVPGATIWVRESNSTFLRSVATSASDGTYLVRGVDRWTEVFARCAGHAPSGLRGVDANPPAEARTFTLDLHLGGTPGAIAGRVVGPDGQPVAGASVSILEDTGSGVDPSGERVGRGANVRLRSDERGLFACADLGPGLRYVVVRARGLPARSAEVVVLPGRTARVEVALPPTARLHGRILDAGGKPVQGAHITARAAEGGASTSIGTDADGCYDTGLVPAGHVRVSASHKSIDPIGVELDLAAGADTEWSPVVGALRAIHGRLVDEADRALQGVVVRCSGSGDKAARTDADGRFVFDGCKDRPHTLWVLEEKDTVAKRTGVWPGDADVVLVRERPTARVVGRLVDDAGAPVAGAFVRCAQRVARSGERGEFELAGLPSGAHRIEPSSPRLQNETLAEVQLRPGALVDVGDVVWPRPGALLVRVHSDEGVPIGWVSPIVRRLGPGGAYLVQRGWDDRGTWRVDELPAGEYELDASGSGVALELRPFRIDAGRTTELDVELRFGSRVHCEVRSVTGAARLEGVALEARSADGRRVGARMWDWSWRAPTDDTELWLRPGRYEVVATAPDGHRGGAWVDIGEPGSPDVRATIELR